jgi:sugar-specific transcriptional regulator TrmB
MKNHLEPMFKEGKKFSEPKSVLLVINGRPNITKKIDELIKKAEQSICIYSSANGIKRLVIHKDLLKEAAARGVNIKIAGVASNDNEEDINLFSFCEFKKIPKAINNLLVIDSKECLVVDPIPDDENIVYGRDFGVIISSGSFTKFLENFFDADFKKAKECKNGNGHKI